MNSTFPQAAANTASLSRVALYQQQLRQKQQGMTGGFMPTRGISIDKEEPTGFDFMGGGGQKGGDGGAFDFVKGELGKAKK